MAATEEGQLVEAARSGDERAFGQLFDRWFDRVHDLSRRIVRDAEVAAEVAQDAFLRAWTQLDALDDVDAFGGWLLRIARNASLNRLDRERRSVAFDDEAMTVLTDLDPDDPDPIARLDRAEQVDLVWGAARALGPRDLSVLDLHLRHGLGPAELAEELGTNRNNANQILHALRGRLATNVRALVLWRAGRPACPDLRATLVGGTGHFDKRTVTIIDRHADACVDCGRERTDRLSPAALFGAAPVVAAPILLKGRAAAALEGAGVPMSGSTALPGVGPTSLTSSTDANGSTGGEGATSPTTVAGPPTATSSRGGGGGDEPPVPIDGGEGDAERRRRRRARVVLALLLGVFAGVVAWLTVAGADDEAEPLTEPTETTVVRSGSAPTVAETSSTASSTASSTVAPSSTEDPTTTSTTLERITTTTADPERDPVDPVSDPDGVTTTTRPPRRSTTTTTTPVPGGPGTTTTTGWSIVLPSTTTTPIPG